MYTSNIPEYIIDLSEDESVRWDEVIERESKVAARLVKQARGQLEDSIGQLTSLSRPISWLFKQLYNAYGGLYLQELESWAEALGETAEDLAVLNCTYELSHFSEWVINKRSRAFGCTAGIFQPSSGGPMHVRNMDWPLSNIGRATRIFRFVNGAHEFISVGAVGQVGVLSGMVPGEYSVTINWAPPVTRPTFEFGPSFLLRDVLETCETYEDAVYALKHTPLSTSVFFALCGAKRGQACVIERTQEMASIRKMKGRTLVLGNHHETKRFSVNNSIISVADNDDEETLLNDSMERAKVLEDDLISLPARSDLEAVSSCLDTFPVCNEESYQQIAFHPATGEYLAWRWV